MKKRHTTKNKTYKRLDLVNNKNQKENFTIPDNELEEFIGYTKNLYKIDCIPLWDYHFRVNVWTEEEIEGSVYPKYSIAKSFFLYYDGLDIVNKTNMDVIE